MWNPIIRCCLLKLEQSSQQRAFVWVLREDWRGRYHFRGDLFLCISTIGNKILWSITMAGKQQSSLQHYPPWVLCNICAVQPSEGPPFVICSCKHIFCNECISNSANNPKSCPGTNNIKLFSFLTALKIIAKFS